MARDQNTVAKRLREMDKKRKAQDKRNKRRKKKEQEQAGSSSPAPDGQLTEGMPAPATE